MSFAISYLAWYSRN